MGLRLILLTAISVVLATAPSAGAIVGGQADGTTHPEVGAVLIEGSGGAKSLVCSGVLVDATHFLTAGHCLFGYSGDVWVEFDPTFVDDASLVKATGFVVHPNFNVSRANPNDLAVVTLPTQTITPATLPALDQFGDRRALRGEEFVVVGYGVTNLGVRYNATTKFKTVNMAWLHLSQNQATSASGGTCFGDSGGPNYDAATHTLASLTNTGDAVCRSTNVTYRLDTPWARNFLTSQGISVP